MNKTLSEVIADILIHNGAVIEKKDDGCLEFLATETLADKLGLPDYGRLRFGYNDSSGDAISATYDSELFKAMAKLLKGKGEFSVASFESSCPNTGKLLKNLNETIVLNNAAFRLEKSETKEISYLLCYFKYTAISDEKREGIAQVLINELNLSAIPFEDGLPGLEDSGEGSAGIERQDIETVFRSSYSAGVEMVKERLKDFVRSLERRLNRDIRRVHEYYEILKNEAGIAIEKKTASTGDRRVREEEIERQLKKKINAIETECKWKVQDLITKYSLNIQIEPLSIIRIETQSPVLWINIRRRLASRSFPVTYNPLIKELDALPCELCFNPKKPYFICDNKLHIICSTCFKICPDCGKQYCGACHINGCPKCGNKIKSGRK
ncbi:MAG TPA: hypothetical protein ENG83_14390 [Nitrospirae bacterium]|nr:hypothetical protein BMS3Abin06_00277 [bacterium BMS3Abin06]HDH13362.1 hypothetical protein [Nitrospirota bacterium]HDZ00730.1 hypothetical protein [Nitrospirota bacterium]